MNRQIRYTRTLQADEEHLQTLWSHVFATRTNRAYRRAGECYLEYCQVNQVDPNTTRALELFISHSSRTRSNLYGLITGISRSLHLHLSNWAEMRNSFQIRSMLRAARRHRPVVTRQASPLKTNHLLLIPEPVSYNEHLFKAMILVGFFGLLRLGDFCWPDYAPDRDWRDVPLRRRVERTMDSISFVTPRTKTDFFYASSTILLLENSDPLLDPCRALRRYLRVRDDRWGTRRPQLFCTKSGDVPTRKWFLRYFKRFFPLLTPHSMRAGGATRLALLGVPEEVIMRAGRWANRDNFQRYIREHPALQAAILSQFQ